MLPQTVEASCMTLRLCYARCSPRFWQSLDVFNRTTKRKFQEVWEVLLLQYMKVLST